MELLKGPGSVLYGSDSLGGTLNVLSKNTGYTEQDYDFKFQYALSNKARLTFAHQYVNLDDVWRWLSTIFNTGWMHGNHVTEAGERNFRIINGQEAYFFGAEFDAFWQIDDQWSARANATFQDGKEKRFDDGVFVDDTIRRLSPISGSVSLK